MLMRMFLKRRSETPPNTDTSIRVSSLHVYPVKGILVHFHISGTSGISVESGLVLISDFS